MKPDNIFSRGAAEFAETSMKEIVSLRASAAPRETLTQLSRRTMTKTIRLFVIVALASSSLSAQDSTQKGNTSSTGNAQELPRPAAPQLHAA